MTHSVLKISPDSVSELLICWVSNLEHISAGFAGLACKDNVVLSKWLLTNTLELVLILFLGRFVLQGEGTSNLANPWWSEGQTEVFSKVLLDNLLAWWTDAEAFDLAKLGLLKVGNDLPLLR